MEQNYEDKIEELDKDITQCESNLLDRNIEIQRLGEEIVDKQNSIDDITSQYAYLESDIKAKRTQSFSRQQL
jgi:predicted  nucleic acid-binding Zn-ribbon protein